MIIPFLCAFILYVTSVFISYGASLKDTIWFYPVGLLNALVVNFIWLYIVRHTPTKELTFVRGFTWDGIRVAAFLIVPILFLGVNLSISKAIGAACIIAGIFLLYV